MSEDPRFLPPTPFSRLMVTHAVSVSADACVAVSLAGTIFFAQPGKDAARGNVLLFLLLTMAPFAIVSPIMGPALDRIKGGRRLMVVFSCLGRAILCLAMAQFITKTGAEAVIIYPLAFGVLVLQKTYSVARAALVPAVVDDESELVRANSRLALVSLVASMVGGAPAFVLQAVFDASWSLVLAMIVFSVATVLATRIPRTQVVQDPEEQRHETEELHQPSIQFAGSAMAVIRVAVGLIVFLSAFSFRDDKLALILVLGAYGAGGFIGNFIAPVARRHVREEIILATCLLGSATFVLLGALTGGNPGGAALAAIAVAIASSAGRVGFDSLLQRDGPEAARGRAFARFETRFQIAWVFGALIGIIPFDKTGLFKSSEGVGLTVLGVVLLAGGLSYLAGLRSARTRPPRTTLRPEAVDRAFDKAKFELRERYRQNREERRKGRAKRQRWEDDHDTRPRRGRSERRAADPAPDPPADPRAPRRRRRPSSTTRRDTPDAFPGGS